MDITELQKGLWLYSNSTCYDSSSYDWWWLITLIIIIINKQL